MKRFIDNFLTRWKTDPRRKPLLVRGARQVGKTYSIREFGTTFQECIEINLEFFPEAKTLFEHDLDPHRIIRDIAVRLKKTIIPGKTLLFFDEAQAVPRSILALRYFYEMMPELHVIAAGSLLDFAIANIGLPVGRVISVYMYPVSFIEFLYALGYDLLVEEILHHEPNKPMSEITHKLGIQLVGQYLAVGGMPEVVQCWREAQSIDCFDIQQTLLNSYRQDFGKYAEKHQIKYLRELFKSIPLQLGHKFKYSLVEGEYRKRELEPTLELLLWAGVVHKVTRSAAQGIPLGAMTDPHDFKILFLDVALAQRILGLNVGSWITQPLEQFINKGELVEAFVGQELLAYSDPLNQSELYYWARQERGSQAEIDYVIQQNEHVVPIEVKSGAGTTLKSMNSFLETHKKSPYGFRFSTQNYSIYEAIHSYPLYAIAKAVKAPVIFRATSRYIRAS